MKPPRLLACLALFSTTQFALAAGPVNRCEGPDGRITMTDRPCGDPAMERSPQHPRQVTAEEIQVEDIFRAREMAKKAGTPSDMSGVTDRGDISRARLADPVR